MTCRGIVSAIIAPTEVKADSREKTPRTALP
jgi:hypothetical protein